MDRAGISGLSGGPCQVGRHHPLPGQATGTVPGLDGTLLILPLPDEELRAEQPAGCTRDASVTVDRDGLHCSHFVVETFIRCSPVQVPINVICTNRVPSI